MVRRGEVRWARHEQAGHRPVVVVSVDRFNERAEMAIVVPLTSRDKWSPPLQVALGMVGKKPAYALPGHTRTVSVESLGQVLGVVDEAIVERCLDAFLEICGRRPRPSVSTNEGGSP